MIRLFFFLMGFVMACGQGSDTMDSAPVSSPGYAEHRKAEGASGEEAGMDGETLPAKRIRSGHLRLVSEDAQRTAAAVRDLARAAGGYVESENEHRYDRSHEIHLQLRVPATTLDSVMDRAAALADRVENRTVSDTDISEPYYDTDARLRSKRSLEERYLELLKSAKNVEEMLAVERELHQVRADIEAMSGQMRGWDRQVAMSQLSISCVTRSTGMDNFWSALRESFGQGWYNLLSLFLVLARGWGLLLAGLLLIWLYRRWRQRRR